MKLLLSIILLLTSCSPFHVDLATSVSYGDKQKVTRSSKTTVDQEIDLTTTSLSLPEGSNLPAPGTRITGPDGQEYIVAQ